MKKLLFYLITITIILIPIYFLISSKPNSEPKTKSSETNSSTGNNYQSQEEQLRTQILTYLEKEKQENRENTAKIDKVIEYFQIRHYSVEQHLTYLEDFLIEVANSNEETTTNLAKLQELVCQYRSYLDNYWKNIHLNFADESLREQWLNKGFLKEQVKEWINIGIKPGEFEFVNWLVNEKGGNYTKPDWILNNENKENLLKEWKNNSKPENSDETAKWFENERWLTDKEIDWATDRIVCSNKFKILPAHQFYYVVEAGKNNESNTYLSFPQLLSDIQDKNASLVFIPVNNPDFHWSLLVYETATKKFYHFDTLRGINYSYVESLVSELAQQLVETNLPGLKKYLVKKHNISQKNNYDCGMAVISIIKRITELWNSFNKSKRWSLNDGLKSFDFERERKQLRQDYLRWKVSELF